MDLSSSPSVCQSVGLSVWKVYCGKTADWIRMPFGMVSGVGQGMGVLDGSGDRRSGRGKDFDNFWQICYQEKKQLKVALFFHLT